MMTTTAFAFVCLTAAVVLSTVALAEGDKAGLKRAFQANTNRFISFRCKEPQPRAVHTDEILGDRLKSAGIYSPPMVVVHRCNDSGCCPQGSYCGSTEVDPVTMVIQERLPGKYHKDVISYIQIEVKNHTACGCTPNGNTPK